jgi:tetratricopeptide (TPR) repeat protein
MRPVQNPQGDNDDKTIFPSEFVEWTEKYGLSAVYRVNGSIDLLKLFVVNDIPVVVKTWLRVDEDIGHFRLVRGFDEKRGVIIQNDSYHGPDKKISYYDFLSMWQPFNYGYIVVYPAEKEELVMAILGTESDEKIAWSKALERAKKEAGLDPENIYPFFNQATSYYQVGDFTGSVEAFEKVEARLPRRMLWYQIEPILSYQKLGRYDRVFEITNKLLDGGNRAFSELYLIRGEVYLAQGDKAKAREQFELALKYKPGYEEALVAIEGM